MKSILLFIGALCIAYGGMTMEKYKECVAKKSVEGTTCDSDC